MIPRWLFRLIVAVPALLLFALAVREAPALAVLGGLVCGLSGLTYLIRRTRGPAPHLEAEPPRHTQDVLLETPPKPD